MIAQIILAIVFSCFLAVADLRWVRRTKRAVVSYDSPVSFNTLAHKVTLHSPPEPPYVYIRVDDAVYPLRIQIGDRPQFRDA